MVRRAMQLSLEEANRGNEEEDVVAAIVSELVTRAANASEEYKDKDGCESSRRESSAVFGNVLAERYVLDDFLASSASQLTKGGLASALAKVKERELVVFFRNNHFSTAFSVKRVLYNLVTDLGYWANPTWCGRCWRTHPGERGGNEGRRRGGTKAAGGGNLRGRRFQRVYPAPGSIRVDGRNGWRNGRVVDGRDAQMAAALLASVRDVRAEVPGRGRRLPAKRSRRRR